MSTNPSNHRIDAATTRIAAAEAAANAADAAVDAAIKTGDRAAIEQAIARSDEADNEAARARQIAIAEINAQEETDNAIATSARADGENTQLDAADAHRRAAQAHIDAMADASEDAKNEHWRAAEDHRAAANAHDDAAEAIATARANGSR